LRHSISVPPLQTCARHWSGQWKEYSTPGRAVADRSQQESELVNYNFTDQFRKVLAMAREEAIRLRHDYVGTEHILLGLVRERKSVAVAVLTNLSVDVEQVRKLVKEAVPPGKVTIVLDEIPYNSGARKVPKFAAAEARGFSHDYVGTEHLLLGLLRKQMGITLFGLLPEPKNIAADVLTRLGISLEGARQETFTLLDSSGSAPHA
jgi:ATP-dependent Clp protease ATP-binding subunit ClpC